MKLCVTAGFFQVTDGDEGAATTYPQLTSILFVDLSVQIPA